MNKANTFKEFQNLKIGDKFKTDLAEGKVLIVAQDTEDLCKGCVFGVANDKGEVCKKVACNSQETSHEGSVVFKEVEGWV